MNARHNPTGAVGATCRNWGFRARTGAIVVAAVLAVGGLAGCDDYATDSGGSDSPDMSACQGSGSPNEKCLDQLNSAITKSEKDWCFDHPTDDGCKYSADPDPALYGN
jgi:hypothetical protein